MVGREKCHTGLDKFIERRWNGPSFYSLYGKHKEEIVHLLLNCPFAIQVWTKSATLLDLILVSTETRDMWGRIRRDPHRKHLRGVLLQLLIGIYGEKKITEYLITLLSWPMHVLIELILTSSCGHASYLTERDYALQRMRMTTSRTLAQGQRI